MGNPHAVQVVADVDAAPVDDAGRRASSATRASRKRVNAGYHAGASIRHTSGCASAERGAGETLACGTGACAAVVAGIRRGLLDLAGARRDARRRLAIAWDGAGKPGHDDRSGDDRVRRRD
ncbi:MAG: hypothetical protein MZW92_68980 [Comamonadaceae bacterium]|nr:hypothetical protein [Comamonadaceae bacterium]